MKAYFYLLCVLYLSSVVLIRGVKLFGPFDSLLLLKILLDVVLFSLCLFGAYASAFKKRRLTPQIWRMVYQATLIMGGLSVVLAANADKWGLPGFGGNFHILDLAFQVLIYVLFAVPVIIYENELKKS